MTRQVYKTEQGRQIVESLYRSILDDYQTLPFKQMFVSAAGVQTHVLRFGEPSNPPLIMLHGTASNSATWLGNVADFADTFCVYCVDIPGEPGLSEPVRFSLASQSPYEWLSQLLDQLSITSASFVTMSLGSWYALRLASRNPERVHCLTMITAGGVVPAKRSFLFKALLFMMLGELGQRMINKAIYHTTEVPSQVLEYQSIVSRHWNPITEVLPVFTDVEIQALTSPVQYFGGDHDALIDSVKTGERLRRLLPHADIHILEDTGHVIIDQFPAIKAFTEAQMQ